MKIIFFDTETNGLDFHKSQIIELAMITVIDNIIVEEYNVFIDIGKDVSSTVKINGITNQMLQSGKPEYKVASDLRKRLTPGTLMVAHNAQFDMSFIYHLLKRHYPDDADSIIENLNWLDTLTVFKDRAQYPHKLCDAVEHYDIPKVNFHRAINDTMALYQVTEAMIQERDDLNEYINIFGYHHKYGISGDKFTFIEYKKQYYNKDIVSSDKILPRRK